MQQANFLHIDDKSSYVFEVQQGWKAVASRYQGLHIHIRPEKLCAATQTLVITA